MRARGSPVIERSEVPGRHEGASRRAKERPTEALALEVRFLFWLDVIAEQSSNFTFGLCKAMIGAVAETFEDGE